MSRRARISRSRRRPFVVEKLEDRRLLVGELIELNLDVTRDGASILDANNNFSVQAGDRFNLDVLYTDLRPLGEGVGAFQFSPSIQATSVSAFRPIVHETQLFEINFEGGPQGQIVFGLEGSAVTTSVSIDDFSNDARGTILTTAESLYGADRSNFRVIDVLTGADAAYELQFVGDQYELIDVPNVTIDVSGVTGGTFAIAPAELPVFDTNGDINSGAFSRSIDRRSSLGGLEIYDVHQGTYQPDETVVFDGVGGNGPFFSRGLADISGYTAGEEIKAFSIPLQATASSSNIQFSIGLFTGNEEISLYGAGEPLTVNDIELGPKATVGPTDTPVDAPYQNPNNRFDVNNDGEFLESAFSILQDVNALGQELELRAVSNPDDGKLPDEPPEPVTTFFDVNGDGFANQADLDDLAREAFGLDFGDAPTAAQTGFAASYPTTLADNGARHIIGNGPSLGNVQDRNADGIPSLDALGDDQVIFDDETGQSEFDDEDGVSLTSAIIASGSSATVDVSATSDGKLDAWIDFNRDGDWNDSGERIFSSVSVVSGVNALTFQVPPSATIGNVYARFRISSDGVNAPTGEARDGEVEDYRFAVVEDTGNESNVQATIPSGASETSVKIEGGDLVVLHGTSELARRATAQITTLQITGSADSDVVNLDFSGGNLIPNGGITVDGGVGQNTLTVTGAGAVVDLTLPAVTNIKEFATLDLTDPSSVAVRINAAAVAALDPTGKTISAIFQDDVDGNNDQLIFTDAADWKMTDPRTAENRFLLVATNQLTGEKVEVDAPHQWQNPINASDVNNDGFIRISDALRIVNELLAREFSDPNNNERLDDPSTVDPWPGAYLDPNGDDRTSALDALRVINDFEASLNEQELAQGEPIASLISPNPEPQSQVIDEVLRAFGGEESPSKLADVSWVKTKQRFDGVPRSDAIEASSSEDTSLQQLAVESGLRCGTPTA